MSDTTLTRINRILSAGMAGTEVVAKLIEEMLWIEHSEDDYEVSVIFFLINGIIHFQVNDNFNGYKNSELLYLSQDRLCRVPEGFWHLQECDTYEI